MDGGNVEDLLAYAATLTVPASSYPKHVTHQAKTRHRSRFDHRRCNATLLCYFNSFCSTKANVGANALTQFNVSLYGFV